MKRGLVTGGSGTIGVAICQTLARQGLHVIVHAHRHLEHATRVVDQIVTEGNSAESVGFDITHTETTHRAIERLLESGPIQVLVNNAGIHDDAPMASRGITVNVVAPGLVDSPMTERLFTQEQIEALVPMKRMGTPQEVAELVAFLASDKAGYISGQIIGINGGIAS